MNLNLRYAAGDNRHLDVGGGRRGSRGGRGGGRGGRGRRDDSSSGGGFGGFGKSKNDIQLENKDEFPTLG